MLALMKTDSPSAPDGTGLTERIALRDGAVTDAEAIEAVHYASREAVYEGRTADWPPAGPDRPGRIDRWRTWLGDPEIHCIVGVDAGDVDAGEVVGFCTVRASQDTDVDPERIAEMPTLYVAPAFWRRGFGRALCTAAVGRARDLGFDDLTLWVLEMNDRARRFYEAFGFVSDDKAKVDEMTTEGLVAQRYRVRLTHRRS
jgi:ribosomal protein S18 acetylase RimI-like enzyme